MIVLSPRSRFVIPALCIFVMSFPAFAADAVVAKVAGIEIKESDLAMAAIDIGERMPQMGEDAKRDYLITYMTDLITLSKEAEARNMAKGPEYERKMVYSRHRVLMDSLLTSEGKAAVTEDAVKKVYDEASGKLAGQKEARARHILVESEDEAKVVVAELKKGKDFAELAGEKSKDPGSGAQGGDLGFFTKERMVPEFAEAAFKLKPGELSDPVKSQFGWHVIKLEELRDRPVPPFDQVRGQLETYVMGKAQSELVVKLREKYKVERVGAAAGAGQASEKK